MNIRITVTKDGGTWRAQLLLEPGGLTAAEAASLAAHGPFELDAGGSFSGTGLDDETLTGITYELDENLVLIPDELPLVQEFDPIDSLDDETGQRAAIWGHRMLERVTAGLTSWLALSEVWERDSVHTIP